MGTLVALLGAGKGTWHEVHSLLTLHAFEKTILFIDAWAAPTYRNEHNATIITLPEQVSSKDLISFMHAHLKEATSGEFDLAINIASGTGKEHAALLAAALSLGVGVRLVTIENGQLTILT